MGPRFQSRKSQQYLICLNGPTIVDWVNLVLMGHHDVEKEATISELLQRSRTAFPEDDWSARRLSKVPNGEAPILVVEANASEVDADPHFLQGTGLLEKDELDQTQHDFDRRTRQLANELRQASP
jgi:hypothetical protein